MTWAETNVTGRRDWAEGLFSLTLAATPSFVPGQFVNLRMGDIKRSYSLASAPGEPAELFIVTVAGGALTPQLEPLAVGDAVDLDDQAQGFFTLAHVPKAPVGWLMATGTGLAPYLSMIRSGVVFAHFEHVVVVHGVRHREHLAYRDELMAAAAARPLTYLPMVSRSPAESVLSGRIPAAIDDGRLEAAAARPLLPDGPQGGHVLLCGNPDMIRDTASSLAAKGLRKHRTRTPGHVTTEKYW